MRAIGRRDMSVLEQMAWALLIIGAPMAAGAIVLALVHPPGWLVVTSLVGWIFGGSVLAYVAVNRMEGRAPSWRDVGGVAVVIAVASGLDAPLTRAARLFPWYFAGAAVIFSVVLFVRAARRGARGRGGLVVGADARRSWIDAPHAEGLGAACGLVGSIQGALVVTRPGGRGLSGSPAADIGLVVGTLCVFDGPVAVGIAVWSFALEQLLEARFLRRPLRGFEMLLLFSCRGVHLASASGRAVTFSHQATLYGEPSNQLWRNPLWCTVLITDGDAVWRIAVRRHHLPAVVAAWDAAVESVAAG